MADWKNIHLVEKDKRIAELEAENARLTAMIHQLGENAATAAREYAEGMEALRAFVNDVAQQWLPDEPEPFDDFDPSYEDAYVIIVEKARALKGAAAHD